MACKYTSVLISCITLYLAFILVSPHPTTPSDDWLLPINRLVLYALVKDATPSDSKQGNTYSMDEETARSVLTRLLRDRDLNLDNVNSEQATMSLMTSWGKMMSTLRSATRKGGAYTKKILQKWKDSNFNVKLGGEKRKLEEELSQERKRRKLSEKQLKKERKTIQNLEKEYNKVAKQLLKKTKRNRTKAHGRYSKQYKRNQKKNLRETAEAAVDLLHVLGVNVSHLSVWDKFGNNIDIVHGENTKRVKIPIDKAVYLKDFLCLSDSTYKSLCKSLPDLPSLKRVKKRTREIDSLFPIHKYDDMIGAWEPVHGKVNHIVDQMTKKYPDEPIPEHIGIKLSGDGTFIGKRIHVVNLTMRVIYGSKHSEEVILAMVRAPEKYEYLSKMFEPLVSDLPSNVSLHSGNTIDLKYYLAGDMKFLNEMCGLGACNSSFSCVWCKCPSSERYDHTQKWSMTNANSGARTNGEISTLSKGPKSKNKSCLRSPILSFIPIHFVVPDPLHLFLRISDQLITQLVQIMRYRDNVNKHSKNVHVDKCTNLHRFQKFVGDLKIPWNFFTNKDSGLMQYRDFTGIEHLKIQKNIKLEDLIPCHPKLEGIKWLWQEFREIIALIKADSPNSKSIEERSRTWVSTYAKTFQAKDVTPYMHVLMNHISESLDLHGPINHFSQQGMEKLNDTITSLFFRSSNHKDTDAFVQVMQKQNRISYLHESCKDSLTMHVHCKICGQAGHNKRTCFTRYRPDNDVVQEESNFVHEESDVVQE